MTSTTQPLAIDITSCKEDIDRHVSGKLTTFDSRGQDITLSFTVDIGMETVELALDGNSHAYIAFNDRILPDSASEEELGYVVVIPTLSHGEEQVSHHFWTDEDYIALEKSLLDQIIRRWDAAKEAARDAFEDALLGAK